MMTWMAVTMREHWIAFVIPRQDPLESPQPLKTLTHLQNNSIGPTGTQSTQNWYIPTPVLQNHDEDLATNTQ